MAAPHPIVAKVEAEFTRESALPAFRPGDTVKVWVKIREGEKTRLQAFEGVCIRRRRGGNRETFTVRKVSYGVGVERVFATHSPNVDRVEVKSHGRVRQGRLYYLRSLRGKAARIKERAYEPGEAKRVVKTAGKKKKRAAEAEVEPAAPAAAEAGAPPSLAKAKPARAKAAKKPAAEKAAKKPAKAAKKPAAKKTSKAKPKTSKAD